ncbi:hypothetical protein V495_04309 [Pseudogymnoascus sp. VKM F-4514 (FW-929)]|nr:hypothetical protein V495_04309 [Pseudogymnoascus sp. VKM F-4514 (FW-929)]KFY66655.1 hypothetical protein V497_00804 [Pseudogymnoascus sp. VKM F-4516 (FW-969)]
MSAAPSNTTSEAASEKSDGVPAEIPPSNGDLEGKSFEEGKSLENALSTRPQIPDFPDGGPRAWSVAIGAAGVLFTTFGYVNAFGIYQEYYQSHQLRDQTPSAISWIGSVQVFFLFGGNLVGGPLFDQYGARTIWPAALAFLFSVMMTSLCSQYYQFMLAQGILGGFSMGMSMSPVMAATAQYFNKNRGAAMGIAVAGSSLGGVIFPIALSKMLNSPNLSFGWTVRIIGFLMLAVLIPSAAAIRARLPPRRGRFFIPSAFTEVKFTSLLFAVFLMMLGVFTPIFYLTTYAVMHGMDVQLASYLIAILNGMSLFGRIIPGILADKLGALNMLCGAGICTGILTLCWQLIDSSASIIVFAVLYGFFSGAIVSLMTVSLAHTPTDPRNIGTYMGMGMAVIAFAALAGPPINGALVSKYGGFTEASIFSGVMITVGASSVTLVKLASGKGLFAKI